MEVPKREGQHLKVKNKDWKKWLAERPKFKDEKTCWLINPEIHILSLNESYGGIFDCHPLIELN